jgi:2-dehydropantoate 2-reductase
MTMRALVLGSGAIGSVIAGFLAREGRDIEIVDPWFQHVEAIKSNGVRVEAVEEDFVTQVPAHHLDELEGLGTYDIVVIAPKSYDTTWMARLATRHIGDDTVVLSAQNGMNDLTIGRIVGQSRMVACVVVMACELVGPGHTKRTSDGNYVSLTFGELGGTEVTPRVKQVEEFFSPIGKADAVADAWEERWGKLTLNVMSNALAGLTNYTTKELWANPAVIDVLIALGRECALVARERGIHMAPVLQKIPHELLISATSTKTSEWAEVRRLLTSVAATRTGSRENTPSLLQDIKKGRRTEVDYINGWIGREAEAAGIDAVVNRAIVREVRSVELGQRPAAPGNAAPLSALVDEYYG